MSIANDYKIEKPRKKQSLTLTRKEWAEVLLWLRPQDGNDKLYKKIEDTIGIFSPPKKKKKITSKR